MPYRPQDFLALEDQAKEAESLLGHKIFHAAVMELRRTLVLQILACPIGDTRITALHTKAKLLDELVGELKSIANAVKMTHQKESA